MAENKNTIPQVKFNLLDKAIASIAPSYGMKRLKAKMLVQHFKNTGYIGASMVRTAGRGFSTFGAASEIDDLRELPALRARSRDHFRNTPLGRAAHGKAVLKL